MQPEQVRPVDYRELMKRVEQVAEAIQRADTVSDTIRAVAEQVIEKFRDELGIYGGRLYHRRGTNYALEAIFGEAKQLPRGLEVPRSYPPLDLCCVKGTVFVEADDPSIDKKLEERLGVKEFACLEVGDEEFILAFNVAPGYSAEAILFSLGILRHTLNQKIRQERMADILREARAIQASILPRRVPTYGNFDLYGRTEPMESVGGDFYDYIPITDKILGMAIADVSGHGLPAALQVRDIHMGLRMGLARDLKIVRTVERLNRIIHRGTLTSRFVSMFYGELEVNGNFIYVNAGHPPPFHMTADGTVHFLRQGGVVLGPVDGATYERGFVMLAPGDLLVFCTDGILETRGEGEDGALVEYGTDRLLELVRRRRGQSAREIVEAIFDAVKIFSGERPPEDDRTVVVLSYPAVRSARESPVVAVA